MIIQLQMYSEKSHDTINLKIYEDRKVEALGTWYEDEFKELDRFKVEDTSDMMGYKTYSNNKIKLTFCESKLSAITLNIKNFSEVDKKLTLLKLDNIEINLYNLALNTLMTETVPRTLRKIHNKISDWLIALSTSDTVKIIHKSSMIARRYIKVM